jgi:hypothetical protein
MVGHDHNILPKLCIIVFLSWANDNEEAYKLGGISMQNGLCPCRFCNVSRNQMHTSSQRLCPNNLRDANLAKVLTDKCQEGTEGVRMWGIPYKTIDRKGYEDYSNEMNAVDDNIDENARDNEQVLFLNSHAINVINNQIRANLNGGYEDGEE